MSHSQTLVELQETLYRSKNPTRRWLHCSRRDWIIGQIERFGQSGNLTTLEVGPGSGVYLPTLSSVSSSVTATDIEDAHLTHLATLQKDLKNLHLLQDNIKSTALKRNSFDLILCSEVIEHIDGTEQVLNQLASLLKDNGILILSTPQKFSSLEMMCKVAFLPGVINVVRMIYKEPILETGHINLMSARQLKRFINQSGLNILESNLSGLYLPLIAEFAGKTGLNLAKSLEKLCNRTGLLSWLLWTQFYVLKKGPHDMRP